MTNETLWVLFALFLMVIVGVATGFAVQGSLANDCEKLGKFIASGKVYTCQLETP